MEDTIPIRREVDADNSCLFSSIAYLLDRKNFNETSPIYFRNMIAEYLFNNTIDESLLDLPLEQYVEEITKPNKWGGGIEIRIFTEIFKIEIAVVDILTNRVDFFGQDKNYENRVYVIYTGIHYDPLVMNFDETGDPEFDITIFKRTDNETLEKFKNLSKKYTAKGDFVDTSKKMFLECLDCCETFMNENFATAHAKNNDHWNFKQI